MQGSSLLDSLPVACDMEGFGGFGLKLAAARDWKGNVRPAIVTREMEYARRKRGRLGGGWKGLVMGLILACCTWPGIRLEGFASAAGVTHCTQSANPCDRLQENRRTKRDLPTDRTLSAHPDDTLPEIQRKNEELRKLLKKTPWPKLKYFWASGRTYSLPLRAESRAVTSTSDSPGWSTWPASSMGMAALAVSRTCLDASCRCRSLTTRQKFSCSSAKHSMEASRAKKGARV